MYCLSEEQTSKVFKGISQLQLEEIAKLFNVSIENLRTSGVIKNPINIVEPNTIFPQELVVKDFCIKSHGLYELLPLITPLLIKLALV